MASNNTVEIQVTADTAQAQAGLGNVNKGLADTGNSAAALQGKAAAAGQGLAQVGTGAEVANVGLGKTRAGVQSISQQLETAKTAVGGFIAAQVGLSGIKEVGQIADDYANLQSRIKLATGEGQAFTTAFDGVVEVAKRTNSNLENTGTLFGKLTEAGKSAGLGTQEAINQSLRLTETVNQAVQLSGASAGASSAAVTQLIQGLQSGVLRGDEFNSVMEQAPRLAKALADGLGVTTGELRKMAEAGSLSSETVIAALKGQSDTLKKEFATLPPTVGKALENLSTSWTVYVGEASKASGASEAAAKAIGALSSNLGTVAGYLIDAGQAAAGLAALRLAQTFTGIGAAAAASATGVATGTAATAANTVAHTANAAAAAREAAAFKVLATDVAAQAAALPSNTAATVANSSAKLASGAAADTAAAGVGRFAAALATLRTFALIGILTNFKDIGTAIGEGAAKLLGYKDRTNELAAAEKLAKDVAADNLALREQGNALLQVAINKQFDLSKAAGLSIAEFDKLTKEGATAAEAIAKIGKDFDLASVPGIKNATAVLDKLAADGKLSATQFEKAWSDALKGVDLTEFEVKLKAAFAITKAEAEKAANEFKAALDKGLDGEALDKLRKKAEDTFAATTRQAQQLEQALNGAVREAIKRTGLDFDVISGGMGKAARSAINDIDAIVRGLDGLKKQGVDTAAVLTASIGKAIATADSQKAIEAVRLQIEGLRKTLGDKVTDGLLDQAKAKALELADALDKAKPGVNSLREAMKELGLTSREELQATAKRAQEAYDVIKTKGQEEGESYVAWQARKGDAARVMLQRLIAANAGVADSSAVALAAMEGLTIVVDAAGRATVQAMNAGADAAGRLGDAAARAGDATTDAAERAIEALERETAAIERAADAQRRRANIDKEGFSTDKAGNRIVGQEGDDAFKKRVGDKYGEKYGDDKNAGKALSLQQRIDEIRRAGNSGTNNSEVTRLLKEQQEAEAQLVKTQTEDKTKDAEEKSKKRLDAATKQAEAEGADISASTSYRESQLVTRKAVLAAQQSKNEADLALAKTNNDLAAQTRLLDDAKRLELEKLRLEVETVRQQADALRDQAAALELRYRAQGGATNAQRTELDSVRQRARAKDIEADSLGAKADAAAKANGAPTASPAPAPAPAPERQPSNLPIRTVNINLTGAGGTESVPTTEAGAAALIRAFQNARLSA